MLLTGDEALEEALAGEVGVVLLEVLLAGGGQLHGNELEAAVLEARDDGANESTLYNSISTLSNAICSSCGIPGRHQA